MAKAYPRGFQLKKAVEQLSRKDKQLGRWIAKVGPLTGVAAAWRKPFEPVNALARSIIFQQLSGKAAATIVGRVEAILPNGPEIRAQDLLDVADEKLRACGVSGSKQRALKDLAEKSLVGIVPGAEELRWLSDKEIIARLTQVRGIGQWTVEMMLIFRLGRPDVFPCHDLGVQKGAQLVRKLESLPTPKQMLTLGERWAPYRTAASLYLWRTLDAPKSKASNKDKR